MSARWIVGCVEAKICFVNTAHGQCPKQGRTGYAVPSSDPLTTLQSVFVCLTLCSVAQSTPRSTPVRRTKSQSSEMDVLALDPATTAYLQACGHQEALVAALEGPDLSHGLDQTDRVGGEGRAVYANLSALFQKTLLCPPQNVLMVKATSEVSNMHTTLPLTCAYFTCATILPLWLLGNHPCTPGLFSTASLAQSKPRL